MSGYRDIIVLGRLFHYRVGRSYTCIRGEHWKTRPIYHGDMLNLTVDAVENGTHKRWLSVKPSDVADYIRKHQHEARQ